MPKMKTHSGAKKRFHVTGGGKLTQMKAHSSHLRRKKPNKVTRKFADKLLVDAKDVKRFNRLLPYG